MGPLCCRVLPALLYNRINWWYFLMHFTWSTDYRVDAFQDFLITEHIKPRMHILKISISSQNQVIVRPTKTPKLADKKMCSILLIKGFKNWSFQKMSITNNVPLNWYSSMKKKIEKDSDNFWHRKLTLKVRNWQFSITWFRAGVDLPENLFYEKVLFFTQLSYHLMCRLLKKSYMLSIN